MKNEIEDTQPINSDSENQNKTIDVFDVGGKKIDKIISDKEKKDLTPTEEADIAWRESETEKNSVKTQVWKAFKNSIYPLASLIGLLLTILAIFWGYKISSISEPIGGIKTDIEYLKNYNNQDVKPAITKINEIKIRMEYIDNNTQKTQ